MRKEKIQELTDLGMTIFGARAMLDLTLAPNRATLILLYRTETFTSGISQLWCVCV